MTRRRAVVSLLVLASGACTRAPDGPPSPDPGAAPPPQPGARAVAAAGHVAEEAAWSTRSADGTAELAQVGEPPAACRLEARVRGDVRWAASRCLARRGQPVFLAPDGETTIVLDQFVPRGPGPGGTGPVVVVSRRGEPIRTLWAADLDRREDPHRLGDGWLAPAERGPEHAPRLADAGDGVRLETASGAVVAVRFDGDDAPADRRAAAAASARGGVPDPGDDVTLYRWQDASGDVHYTVASEVPRDRARTARRVTAQIGTVAVERVGEFRRTPSGPAGPAASRSGGAPAQPPPPRAAPPRSTYHVDTINSLPGMGTRLDADAMDRQYEKQKKDMNCREVNGVVICG